MPVKKKAIFSWSGGKDSTLALYYAINSGEFDIHSLLTSFSPLGRVTMHGVQQAFITQQAKSLGIPLATIQLPNNTTSDDYRKLMQEKLNIFSKVGVRASIFGDIFLEDLKEYRETMLKKINHEAYFPLWKMDTKAVIQEFINLGFKTVVVCIKNSLLTKDFLGKVIDNEFLEALPKNVDPCGENGEFHTFTFDGPLFKFPINYEIGKIVTKSYPITKAVKLKKELSFSFCQIKESN